MSDWGSEAGEAPAGLIYASECAEPQAVIIAAGDVSIAAVVEPGHDPGVMWTRLRVFLEGEGILAPDTPS